MPDFFVSRVVATARAYSEPHSCPRVRGATRFDQCTSTALSSNSLQASSLGRPGHPKIQPWVAQARTRSGADWCHWGPGEGPNPHLSGGPRGRTRPTHLLGVVPHLQAVTSPPALPWSEDTQVTEGTVAPGREGRGSPHPTLCPAPTSSRRRTLLRRRPGEPRPPQRALEQTHQRQGSGRNPTETFLAAVAADLTRRGPEGLQELGLDWRDVRQGSGPLSKIALTPPPGLWFELGHFLPGSTEVPALKGRCRLAQAGTAQPVRCCTGGQRGSPSWCWCRPSWARP